MGIQMASLRKMNLLEKREQLCRKLGEVSTSMIRGSLVKGGKKCGRKGCSCESGELHRHVVISTQREGKSHIVYVPLARESQAVASIAAYAETWRILEEISLINLELFKAGALSAANQQEFSGEVRRNGLKRGK